MDDMERMSYVREEENATRRYKKYKNFCVESRLLFFFGVFVEFKSQDFKTEAGSSGE